MITCDCVFTCDRGVKYLMVPCSSLHVSYKFYLNYLCFIGFDYLWFLPVTEREVPNGALPHGQGVRSVEAGPRVSDRGQCQGHLRSSCVVLPGTSTEGMCRDCVLRLSILLILCQINPFNCIILRKFLLV